jgi:hypothetical protein
MNLRRKKSWIYGCITMFIFVGFFSLVTSKIYLGEEIVYHHTEIGKELDLTTNNTMQIENWDFNSKENEMEVLLKMSDSETEHSFEAFQKSSAEVPLPLEIVYQDQGQYALYIEHISPNWEALAIDIYDPSYERTVDLDTEENEKEESETTPLKTIYADQMKTNVNDDLYSKNENVYAMYFIEIERTQLNEHIKQLNQLIQDEEKKQTEIKMEIKTLEENSKYETEIEKVDTQSDIKYKEDEIKESLLTIEEYQFEKENATEKLSKLKQKEQDLLKQ